MIKYTVLNQIDFVIAHLIVDDCIYCIQKECHTPLYHKFCFRNGWLGKTTYSFELVAESHHHQSMDNPLQEYQCSELIGKSATL